jgi:hypothetical protein
MNQHGKTGLMSQVVCFFSFTTLLTRKLVHFNNCVVTPMTHSPVATCDWSVGLVHILQFLQPRNKILGSCHSIGDFKIGCLVYSYMYLCTANTSTNTKFEITHYGNVVFLWIMAPEYFVPQCFKLYPQSLLKWMNEFTAQSSHHNHINEVHDDSFNN